METREEKYIDNDTNTMSRTKRNEILYKTISEKEITEFDVNSNSEILSNNNATIDIDKLRDMLDKKYREEPRNKSIGEAQETDTEEIKLVETREYDINNFMNKAKEEKQSEDYEIERLKKLRNTQTDILNSLDIVSEEKVEDSKTVSKEESDKLMELINTINVTEAINKYKLKEQQKEDNENKIDPLDILTTLKGNNDDTKIMSTEELRKDVINEVKEEKELKEEKQKDSDDTKFFTTSNMVTQDDFDDFKDLREEVTTTKIIIKILIVIVVLGFIAGIIFILNKVLGWNLF